MVLAILLNIYTQNLQRIMFHMEGRTPDKPKYSGQIITLRTNNNTLFSDTQVAQRLVRTYSLSSIPSCCLKFCKINKLKGV
jgi:hypothetical protein